MKINLFQISTIGSIGLVCLVSGITISNFLKPNIRFKILNSTSKFFLESDDEDGGSIKMDEYSKSKEESIGRLVDKKDMVDGCGKKSIENYSPKKQDLYEKVLKGCTAPTTNEEHLISTELSKSNSSFIEESDEEGGKGKSKKYSDLLVLPEEITRISVKKDGSELLKNDVTPDKLKIGCLRKRKKYFKKNVNSELKTIKFGCIKE